jgi:hypothetical protein
VTDSVALLRIIDGDLDLRCVRLACGAGADCFSNAEISVGLSDPERGLFVGWSASRSDYHVLAWQA